MMRFLSNEELCALAQSGNKNARDELGRKNLPFVIKTAGEILYNKNDRETYEAMGVEKDELVQAGSIGLAKAIDSFAPDRGNKFITYAAVLIKNEIYDRIREYSEKFEWKTETDERYGIHIVSLNEPVFDDDQRSELGKIIPDPFCKTPERIYIDAETQIEIREAIRSISDREQKYIFYRFGFDEEDREHTFIQTAEHFRLSQSRARTTEKLALDNVWLELPWWYELRRDKAKKAKERLRETEDDG